MESHFMNPTLNLLIGNIKHHPLLTVQYFCMRSQDNSTIIMTWLVSCSSLLVLDHLVLSIDWRELSRNLWAVQPECIGDIE